ncbi:hypothetical protein FLONG3_6665 [Fusarium longipes]|uniref:DUF6536 domain-containing protein n=1 Tax=Fusarium longipes TaxID=694270 RepID=A0A395SKN3_9HYPO|nr:hypothetical protein FLONG3_6665 [Fusarium longipes]
MVVVYAARWKFNHVMLTGWRRLATYLTILVFILSILLIALLITSVSMAGSQGSGFQNETVIWKADCTTTAQANLWIHLAINIFATGILASSNFFMQVLAAPTRHEIDKAHASGGWAEIGCNSIRNFRLLSRRKIFLWFLFTLSSVPLHLIFNSCVLESKASKGFFEIIASDGFLTDSHWSLPGVAGISSSFDKAYEPIIAKIQKDAKSMENWERIDIKKCYNRYSRWGRVVSDYRHVIFVVKFWNGTRIDGWDKAQLLNDSSAPHSVNTLWDYQLFIQTDSVAAVRGVVDNKGWPRASDFLGFSNTHIDPGGGRLDLLSGDYDAGIPEMVVDHCISEASSSQCRILIANRLLLIVCIMCILKSFLCIFTLLSLRATRHDEPLMTPGDAIASFIAKPGADTRGMCTLSSKTQDTYAKGTAYGSPEGLSPWLRTKRTAGKAIPWHIWILSFLLIGICLATGLALCIIAVRDQPIIESQFQRSASNSAIRGSCTVFSSLRVTNPTGQQRSTYRLQLPYRWSIPLLTFSTVLHWVYSNCIYVNHYDYYSPVPPYNHDSSSYGLQYSSIAILVALVLSTIIAIAPLIFSRVRLPGDIVLGGNNSQVISAACHCIPPTPSLKGSKSPAVTIQTMTVVDNEEMMETLLRPGSDDTGTQRRLQEMAENQLKWGEVLDGSRQDNIGHLAFGSKEQGIVEPIEGKLYK